MWVEVDEKWGIKCDAVAIVTTRMVKIYSDFSRKWIENLEFDLFANKSKKMKIHKKKN